MWADKHLVTESRIYETVGPYAGNNWEESLETDGLLYPQITVTSYKPRVIKTPNPLLPVYLKF
jgi:hypothetical protein